jgi:hypothetical protein
MLPANIAMLAKHATAMETIIGQVIQKSPYINRKCSSGYCPLASILAI